jgi:hypothetical protein
LATNWSFNWRAGKSINIVSLYCVSIFNSIFYLYIHVFLDVPVFPLHVNFLSRGVSRAPRRRASQKHDQQRLRNSTVGFRTGLGNLKKPNCASRFLFS